MKTSLSFLTLLCFFITGTVNPMPVCAQQGLSLPKPGVMVHLSPTFNPPVLKGIKVHPDNPFRFDFILDRGDVETHSNASLQNESIKLIKYFLASLTTPEKDLWVNLSPYEKNRIVPESFGQTEMGRDLLAQDYMLKQITASLIYPEDDIGKRFWKRLYEEAAKKFNTTNIPINTFNKVWIIPEKAVVYENAKAGTAYVVESKLKVMLEQDYLALEKSGGHVPEAPIGDRYVSPDKGINAIGSQIVREIVIPELTKEINKGKNFAQLRQVYHSLILATWYKKKIKDSVLNQVYADRNKISGVNINDPQEKQKIYEQYLQAFKKGVYNYIKEDYDPATQQVIPRKYFSGGVQLWFSKGLDSAMMTTDSIAPQSLDSSDSVVITTDMAMASQAQFHPLRLEGGADLILPASLSDADRSVLERSNTDYIFEPETERFVIPSQDWAFNDTSFDLLDARLRITQAVLDIAHRKNGRPITILELGSGDGTGLIGLKEKLKGFGITNVEFIGYSNRLYLNRKWKWRRAPGGIVFTPDIRYIEGKQVDLIYSHLGIENYVFQMTPEEIIAHLEFLKHNLAPQGILRVFADPFQLMDGLEKIFSPQNVKKFREEGSQNPLHAAGYVEASLGVNQARELSYPDKLSIPVNILGFLEKLRTMANELRHNWYHLTLEEAKRAIEDYLDVLNKLGSPKVIKIGGETFMPIGTIEKYQETIKEEEIRRGISRRERRPFIESGRAVSTPHIEYDNRDTSRRILAHATSFQSLYKVIFDSKGKITTTMIRPFYYNSGDQGARDQVRLHFGAGIVPIVLYEDQLKDIKKLSLGEGAIINGDISLSAATIRSKAYMWSSILTEIEARNEEFTDSMKLTLANALGYDNYNELEVKLSDSLEILFDKFN
ncbi:MAG: hypothetical protein HY591_06965, partial [Candidatus Omnitrophica bacterium]|nr:hypothetical protein [Candidatus Omnitrophota bacterium]